MTQSAKKIWFEGSTPLPISLAEMEKSLSDPGAYLTAVIGYMPGMTSVELLEQGPNFVIIQTNEGRMTRSNIEVNTEEKRIIFEFDEKYQAGKAITTHAHFRHEFKTEGGALQHKLTISSLKAPGLLGFFYRNFGRKSMGRAFLAAHRKQAEQRQS